MSATSPASTRRGPETDFFRIRSLATGDVAAMRFGGTESAERFVIEPETTNAAVEQARRALANAQRNEHRAGVERVAGRISKSCHRDAVRVRIDAEARLQDALALTCEQCGEVFAGPTCVDCSDGD